MLTITIITILNISMNINIISSTMYIVLRDPAIRRGHPRAHGAEGGDVPRMRIHTFVYIYIYIYMYTYTYILYYI